MAQLAMTVQSRRLLPGCSGGLTERTAIIEVALSGDVVTYPDADSAADARIRAGVLALCPEEPLFGVAEQDWPAAFLWPAVEDIGSESARWLGDWVVAVTVAVQRWSRDPVFRGRVLAAEPDRLRLAIPWRRDWLLTDALELALRLVGQWCQPDPDRAALAAVQRSFREGLPTAQGDGLTPNMLRFVGAAVQRDIPFEVLLSWVQLGWGARAERLNGSYTGRTSLLAARTARDKFQTSRTLADAGLPMPTGQVVATLEHAYGVADKLGWPVVVKPLDSDQGAGVVPGIRDAVALQRAFDAAIALSPGNVIVERHVEGADHRMLVMHGRLIAAARRTPAGVIGDGAHTVGQLIDRVNADPLRGTDVRSILRKLVVDAEMTARLADQGLTVNSVPEPGRPVALRNTANISSGGTADDVTAEVHPDNRCLAERAARLIGLDIAGVDFITPDVSRSWREVGGAICEVNAQPGFRPHWLADPGRDINGDVLDVLFGEGPTRIPTVAITGTNGKTTTSMMVHHIWMTAGKCAGVATTVQVLVGDEVLSAENLSGLPGARMLLTDPAVEVAVLEMPRKGLIVFGHPCDRYDVAALLNVRNDHIGEDGVETLEQMAELKAEVLERARRAVVVNADDPLCMAMRSRAGTDRHILVTSTPAAPAVVEHRRQGGEVVFLDRRGDEPWIILAAGDAETSLIPAREIPATMNGQLRVNETNAMFAAALTWAQGVDPDVIRRGLGSFGNSVEQNPGRYNFIDGLPFQLMLDFAHNPDGVREVCGVVAKIPVAGRRILCSRGLGSRSAAQFAEVSSCLAETFEEFVLGCIPRYVEASPDYPGPDPVTAMLSTTRESLLAHGVLEQAIATVADPPEAVRMALSLARPDDLLVILAEPTSALPLIHEYRLSL